MSDSPIEWPGKGLLLDVEGTTSAVAYVYDVMFPFARRALSAYLDAHWNDPVLAPVKELVAQDAGAPDFTAWTSEADPREKFREEVTRLMDADIKATGLKQLQGLIWESGFRSGELKAHVFADVASALEAWVRFGCEVRIYSSGSVHAQKLFFGHTEAGDLTRYLSGHYDTTTGPKKESDSYRLIAQDWGLEPREILFLSDVIAELDAAREAGMATALVVRPGNAPIDNKQHGHQTIASFVELKLL